MNKNVFFSLSLIKDSNPKNVCLLIDGKDPVEMKHVPINNQNQFIIYKIGLPINSLTEKYPNKIFYNYIINGALAYENNQQLLLAKKPLFNNIFVNDLIEHKREDSYLAILFFIRPPISDDKKKTLCLKSDAPVFAGKESQLNIISMKQEGDYYFCVGRISVYLNQPIVYKYYINDENNKEILREEGRMHTIYIHSAVPGKVISVYDIWNGSIPYFSYYPQVITPDQTPISESTVSYEYSTPDFSIKSVAIADKHLKKYEQLFFSEGCWKRVFQIPKNNVIWSYFIGTGASENIQSIDWNNAYKGDIIKPSDYVSSRVLFEPSTYKKLIGIFIPLVSIRGSPSQPVGDFKTLVSLAKWCNSVHISCIHVHIEHLHHGLLDPIHADGINWPDEDENDTANYSKSTYKFKKVSGNKNENQNVDPMNCSFHASHHGGLLLPQVREEKIKALYKKFLEWNQIDADKNDFNLFLQCNEYIAKHCNGIFEQWVQFTLFNQLQNAFLQIFETGVQLITDVVIPSQPNDSNKTHKSNATNNNNNNDGDDDYDEYENNDNENDQIAGITGSSNRSDSTKVAGATDLDLINELKIASHYSHSLMIVGLCSHPKPFSSKKDQPKQRLTVDFVRNVFGDIAQNVIDTFFRVSSFSINLLDNAFVPKMIHSFASKLNSGMREEFEKNMEMIINIKKNESAYTLTELQNEQISQLSLLAPNCSASLILDQMSCEVLNPEIVSKMNILPYSNVPIRITNNNNNASNSFMQCLGPMLLSPEMVSEFPSDMQAEVIADVIKQRIASKEHYVEVYFTDILRALGYDTDIEPIQTIEDNCRFLLQFTIQDLFRESETSDKIRSLLASPIRGMI